MRLGRLPHGSTYVLVFNRRGELFVHLRAPDKALALAGELEDEEIARKLELRK